MTDLMDLASRVEAREGPDRDLDADIQDAVRLGGYKADRDGCSGRLCGTMTRMASNGDGVEWKPLPAFTASLDAALTLVPPGDDATGELFRLEAYFTNGVLVPTHVRASAWVPGAPRAYAATPAMALTAACLRARAHQGAAHVD